MSFLNKGRVLPILFCSLFFSAFSSWEALSWSAKGKHNIYIGANVGIMGVQGYGAYYYKNLIGLKVSGGKMPKKITNFIGDKIENLEDDLSLKLNMYNYGFAVSVRPLKGSWYIDLGLAKMNYSGDVKVVKPITGMYADIADIYGVTSFNIAKGIKPYLEMGWNFNVVAGLSIDFALGVIYTGKWKADYPNVYILYTEDYLLNQQPLLDDAIKECIDGLVEEKVVDIVNTVDDLNKDIPSFLKFWPVIKFGLSYRFDI